MAELCEATQGRESELRKECGNKLLSNAQIGPRRNGATRTLKHVSRTLFALSISSIRAMRAARVDASVVVGEEAAPNLASSPPFDGGGFRTARGETGRTPGPGALGLRGEAGPDVLVAMIKGPCSSSVPGKL